MENQEISVELLSRLCRTCAVERSHMSPLFARDSDVSCRLDDMLMSCTNLKILEADGFPNSICVQCVDELKSAYQFQQRCETADRYYKRLRLKPNLDCTETPMVFNLNYDYIEMLQNNLIVFRCRECCQAFNKITELKTHKLVHLKKKITEENHESLRQHHLQMNQKEEIDGGDVEDSKSSFLKKFNICNTEENFEMDAIPMESKIKEEELSTFIDIVVKEEKEGNAKDEYMSNLFLEQSYQQGTKKLEVATIQKEIEKDSLLEVLKETDEHPDNNIESSSSDNWDEDYSPTDDSDSEYFPNQTHQIDIGTKNQKYRNRSRTCEQHRLPKNLRRHQLTHNSCKPFKCDVCQKSFTCNSNLNRHKWMHNPNKRFKCDVCEKRFTYSSNLRTHKLMHNADKPFKCGICEKSFSHSRNFQQHKWMHSPNKRLKCDVCRKSFISGSKLNRHKWIHNPNKRFKCDVCEKRFTYSSNLKTHKLMHNGEKPFKCDVCEKLFSRNKNLQQHQWTHNPNKRFKCDVCEKLFTYSSNLTTHKLTHNADKPFKCNVCEKSFARNSTLRQHEQTHDPNKCFKCDVCEKSFSGSRNLRSHQLIHNVYKFFKCDTCEKSFSRNWNLQQHKWTHDPNKPFKCDVCNKSYASNSMLKRHKLVHTAINKHCDFAGHSGIRD